MNWYYAAANQQVGPISDEEFQKLVATGTIQPATLVWHDGLTGWQPYSNVTGRAAVPAVASAGAALDLRPMGIGDILDRTFRLYRSHFMPFFLIMLVVQAVSYVASLGWQISFAPNLRYQMGAGHAFVPGAQFFVGMFLLMIVVFVLNQIGIATLTAAVSAAYLQQEVSIGQAYRAVRGKLGRLFGATLLNSLLVGLGLVLCLLPGVYLMLSFLLVSEVVVLENLGARAALRRSRELMRVKSEKGFVHNNITKASVILLITFILGAVVGGVVSIPFGIAQVMSRSASQPVLNVTSPLFILQGVITMLVQAAVAPVGRIAMILFYYDIRIRKEGFDLEVLAAALNP